MSAIEGGAASSSATVCSSPRRCISLAKALSAVSMEMPPWPVGGRLTVPRITGTPMGMVTETSWRWPVRRIKICPILTIAYLKYDSIETCLIGKGEL